MLERYEPVAKCLLVLIERSGLAPMCLAGFIVMGMPALHAFAARAVWATGRRHPETSLSLHDHKPCGRSVGVPLHDHEVYSSQYH